MPSATNGVTDMFWSSPWNDSSQSDECTSLYNVAPRMQWADIQYGGTVSHIKMHSMMFELIYYAWMICTAMIAQFRGM
jgi:hypothetical protein